MVASGNVLFIQLSGHESIGENQMNMRSASSRQVQNLLYFCQVVSFFWTTICILSTGGGWACCCPLSPLLLLHLCPLYKSKSSAWSSFVLLTPNSRSITIIYVYLDPSFQSVTINLSPSSSLLIPSQPSSIYHLFYLQSRYFYTSFWSPPFPPPLLVLSALDHLSLIFYCYLCSIYHLCMCNTIPNKRYILNWAHECETRGCESHMYFYFY